MLERLAEFVRIQGPVQLPEPGREYERFGPATIHPPVPGSEQVGRRPLAGSGELCFQHQR